MTVTIAEVDAELCEDGRTILLYGYAPDETLYLATIPLPFHVDPEGFMPDEWADVRNVVWRRQ
jgi:hypothetical protein